MKKQLKSRFKILAVGIAVLCMATFLWKKRENKTPFDKAALTGKWCDSIKSDQCLEISEITEREDLIKVVITRDDEVKSTSNWTMTSIDRNKKIIGIFNGYREAQIKWISKNEFHIIQNDTVSTVLFRE